jgi:putative ABC transport system permease protein
MRRSLAKQLPPGTKSKAWLLADDIELAKAKWTRSADVLSAFGGVIVILTVLGIYGGVAYDLAQRRREVGIRLALGALPGQLRNEIVRTALKWAVIGGVTGAAIAVACGFGARALLFATEPLDVGVLALASVIVFIAASFAAWAAVQRALVTEPTGLLKEGG